MMLSTAQTAQYWNDTITNAEISRMWQEAVVVKFEILSWDFTISTEENHENLNQGSWSPGSDLNYAPSEYSKSEVLLAESTCLVICTAPETVTS
jgi:hypothetical protein